MLIETMRFIRSEKSRELELTKRDKNVLIMLADLIGGNDYCWPSKEELLNICDISDKTLRKALKKLEEENLITLHSRSGKTNHISINETIIPRHLTPGTFYHPTPGTFDQKSGVTPGTFDRAIEKSNNPLKATTHKNKNNAQARDLYFEQFWLTYPKREGKKVAHKIWTKNNLDEIAQKIIDHVKARQWPPDPKFIPLASTFLNGERWEDEITKTQETKNERHQRLHPSGRPETVAEMHWRVCTQGFSVPPSQDTGNFPRHASNVLASLDEPDIYRGTPPGYDGFMVEGFE